MSLTLGHGQRLRDNDTLTGGEEGEPCSPAYDSHVTTRNVNVKEKWGKLTDDDLDVVAGKRDQLEGKIQERYGIAKDQVSKDIDTWYGTQKW